MTALDARSDDRRGDREERKYPLAEARVPLAAAWLDARFAPDPQYPEGVITSCYYDTPRLAAWYESLDGDYAKAKHRVRWYGDPADPADGAWLEVKFREGRRSGKARVHLDAPDGGAPGPDLRLPAKPALAAELIRLGHPPPADLRPTMLIRYRRRRWIDRAGDLRISLDRAVGAAEPRDGHSPAWIPLRGGAVLELKSAGPLPISLRGLERLGLRRAAHSKYALAVAEVLGDRAARA